MNEEKLKRGQNMQATGNPNINTREYWDEVYKTPEKRKGYAAQGTHSTCAAEGKKTARFERTLQEVKNGDKFLDIGCGVGLMTSMVKEKYPDCDVYGVDISAQVVEDNKKEHPNINYTQGEVGNLSYPDNFFDVIFSGETIEHLDEPQLFFEEAFRFLKKKGKLIITTPLMDNIQSPEHTWLYTQDDVTDLYEQGGITNIQFVYLPDQEHLMVIYAIGTKE